MLARLSTNQVVLLLTFKEKHNRIGLNTETYISFLTLIDLDYIDEESSTDKMI